VTGVLVYCWDHRCSHSKRLAADQWPDDVRLSDIEPRFVCEACARRGFDASLRRLGIDHVDLYLLHWPVPSAFEVNAETRFPPVGDILARSEADIGIQQSVELPSLWIEVQSAADFFHNEGCANGGFRRRGRLYMRSLAPGDQESPKAFRCMTKCALAICLCGCVKALGWYRDVDCAKHIPVGTQNRCKIARNTDPLRGDFASNSDPS
jgi:hypothetical protein